MFVPRPALLALAAMLFLPAEPVLALAEDGCCASCACWPCCGFWNWCGCCDKHTASDFLVQAERELGMDPYEFGHAELIKNIPVAVADPRLEEVGRILGTAYVPSDATAPNATAPNGGNWEALREGLKRLKKDTADAALLLTRVRRKLHGGDPAEAARDQPLAQTVRQLLRDTQALRYAFPTTEDVFADANAAARAAPRCPVVQALEEEMAKGAASPPSPPGALVRRWREGKASVTAALAKMEALAGDLAALDAATLAACAARESAPTVPRALRTTSGGGGVGAAAEGFQWAGDGSVFAGRPGKQGWGIRHSRQHTSTASRMNVASHVHGLLTQLGLRDEAAELHRRFQENTRRGLFQPTDLANWTQYADQLRRWTTYAPLALQEQQLARRERVGEAAAPVWWLSADGTVSSLEQQLQQVVILFEGRQLPDDGSSHGGARIQELTQSLIVSGERTSSGLDQLESDVVDFWALVLDTLSDRYPRAGVTRELIDRYETVWRFHQRSHLVDRNLDSRVLALSQEWTEIARWVTNRGDATPLEGQHFSFGGSEKGATVSSGRLPRANLPTGETGETGTQVLEREVKRRVWALVKDDSFSVNNVRATRVDKSKLWDKARDIIWKFDADREVESDYKNMTDDFLKSVGVAHSMLLNAQLELRNAQQLLETGQCSDDDVRFMEHKVAIYEDFHTHRKEELAKMKLLATATAERKLRCIERDCLRERARWFRFPVDQAAAAAEDLQLRRDTEKHEEEHSDALALLSSWRDDCAGALEAAWRDHQDNLGHHGHHVTMSIDHGHHVDMSRDDHRRHVGINRSQHSHAAQLEEELMDPATILNLFVQKLDEFRQAADASMSRAGTGPRLRGDSGRRQDIARNARYLQEEVQRVRESFPHPVDALDWVLGMLNDAGCVQVTPAEAIHRAGALRNGAKCRWAVDEQKFDLFMRQDTEKFNNAVYEAASRHW